MKLAFVSNSLQLFLFLDIQSGLGFSVIWIISKVMFEKPVLMINAMDVNARKASLKTAKKQQKCKEFVRACH